MIKFRVMYFKWIICYRVKGIFFKQKYSPCVSFSFVSLCFNSAVTLTLLLQSSDRNGQP